MKKLLNNIYEFILLLLIGVLFFIDYGIKSIFRENKGIFKISETNNSMDVYEINDL